MKKTAVTSVAAATVLPAHKAISRIQTNSIVSVENPESAQSDISALRGETDRIDRLPFKAATFDRQPTSLNEYEEWSIAVSNR